MTKSEAYADLYVDFIRDWLNPAVKVIPQRTSGSTGQPKTILLPKDLMRRSARRTIDFFGITSGWLLTSELSAEYIGGKMMAVRALEIGAKLVCEPPSNRPQLRAVRECQRNALVAIVPSQMWHILKMGLSDEEKSRIRFLIGGSPIPPDMKEAIENQGINAWESYGMTETASHIALRKIETKELPFTPLPGIDITLSEKGTLIIRENPDSDPLITNDFADIDHDGYFRILGRADNVIISGGLKVIPEQVEEKIRLLLAASQITLPTGNLAISSIRDEKWGEATVLVIEDCSGESQEKLGRQIMEILRNGRDSGLKTHEIPKHIMFLHRLPLTKNGKIDRPKLKMTLALGSH